jgi:tetratricopeptide (TPR) repeat protein
MILMMRYALPILFFLGSTLPYLVAQTNVIGAKVGRTSEVEADDESLFVDANQQYLLGEYGKALDIALKFSYAHERNDGGFFLLSRIYIAQKDYQNALIAAKKASELDPKNKWYYHLQGDIYEVTSRNKDAADIYEKLLKMLPNAPLYYEKVSYLYTLDGEPTKALDALNRYQKALGMSEEIADRRHLIYLGMKNDRGATQAYEDLIAIYPRSIPFLHKLANYYKTTTRTDEAAGVYRRILALKPDDPEARIGAMAKREVGNETDFLATLRPLLSDPTIGIDSKIEKLMPFLRKMEQEKDSTKRAMMQNAATELTVTHPNEAKAWSFAGDVHYLLGQNEIALSQYKKCIALQANVFGVWQNTYDILDQQKNYKELLAITEKGMDAFPNQPASYFYYGLAANQLNKPADALTQLQQGLFMSGSQTAMKLDISAQIGLAQIKLNKPEKAIEILEVALTKGGTKHPFVLEYLGDAYAAKGNQTKAAEQWRLAEKIQTSEGLRKKIGI